MFFLVILARDFKKTASVLKKKKISILKHFTSSFLAENGNIFDFYFQHLPSPFCSAPFCRRLPSPRLQAASMAKHFLPPPSPLGFNFFGENSHREHFSGFTKPLRGSCRFRVLVFFFLLPLGFDAEAARVGARLHPVTANKTKHLRSEGGSRAKFLPPTAAVTRRKSQHPFCSLSADMKYPVFWVFFGCCCVVVFFLHSVRAPPSPARRECRLLSSHES